MKPLYLNLFATALLAMVATPSFAQALNARWHGYWKSSEDTLSIHEQAFKIGKDDCRWANARPDKINGCAAFYEGSISKNQLMTQFEQTEKATKELLKTSQFKQAQKDRIQEAMDKNRQVLSALSNDTFRKVHTMTPSNEKGSGDCASFYFLDQQTVHFVLSCTPAPEAYSVRPYKKSP